MNKDKINIKCKTIKLVHRISEIYRLMYCFIHKKILHEPVKKKLLKEENLYWEHKNWVQLWNNLSLLIPAILNISIRKTTHICHLGK